MAGATEKLAVGQGVTEIRVFSVEFDVLEDVEILAAPLACPHSRIPQLLFDGTFLADFVLHEPCIDPAVELESAVLVVTGEFADQKPHVVEDGIAAAFYIVSPTFSLGE